MQNFVELLKDHTLIMAAGKSLAEIALGREERPAAAFVALRQLATRLETHLRAEDEFIRLDHDCGHGDFAALALEHGQRFDVLVADWTLYLRDWTEDAIGRDWSRFGEATLTILAALAEQVEAENQALYPAALKYGLIRLLPEGGRDAMRAA